MRIERQSYVDKLEERRENGSVKIITGIRCCGKTYLLFDLYAERLMETGAPADRIIQIALDDDENAALRDPGKLREYIGSRLDGERGMSYVMIDEVQYAITREELADRDNPPRVYGVLNGLLRRGNVDV